MPIDSNGRFYPSLFPKQLDVLKACLPGNQQNMIFLNGPRQSSKTVVCHHAVAQHAWNTNHGNICILAYTQSVGIDSGIWPHLTEGYLQDWIDGNFGLRWIKRPYIQNITKKPTCVVSNKWGNQTKISLESLKDEKEVEKKFKGREYSMIWVSELTKFKFRRTFDTLKQCFRGNKHLTEKDYLFLSDFNPDLDLGKASPWYNLLYEEHNMEERPEHLKPLHDSIKLFEFTLDDNLSLSEEKKKSLMADFSYSEDMLQSYYYGKWSNSLEGTIFHKVFRPNFHVVGEIAGALNEYRPEILVPHPGCFQLITGNDPGVTNCASVILDKVIPDPTLYPKYRGFPIFNQLDELVITGQDFDLESFVETLVNKMDEWEQLTQQPAKVIWTHWSDRSVFDMKVPFSDRYWHQHIFEASGGRLIMRAAGRGKGSVQQRVDLMRKLLFQERYFVCNDKCPQTIEMFKSLKKGTTAVGGIARGSVHKHVFDALTYALASECYDELENTVILNLQKDSAPEVLRTVAL